MNYALAAEIGARIRQLRKARGWSQAELAGRVGVNKSVIGFYELGTRFPTYDKLLRISDIFAVSTDYLLRGDGTKQIGVEALPDDQLGALRIIISALQQQNKD